MNIKIVKCRKRFSLSLSLSFSLSPSFLFLSVVSPTTKQFYTPHKKGGEGKKENDDRLVNFSNPFPIRIRTNEIE